eukprot:sb/3478237/
MGHPNTYQAGKPGDMTPYRNYSCSDKILYLFFTTNPHPLLGKVHGSLARAGKVKGQTPKVAKEEDKKKKKTGRCKRRIQYNRRFSTAVNQFGRKKGPNSNSD